MPRKKKETNNTELPALACAVAPATNQFRDWNGLIVGLPLYKDDIGFINWRRYLPSDYLGLNKTSFAKRGIDTSLLSKEETEKLKKESPDEDLVIKLAGFRFLAKLRGYHSIEYSFSHVGEKVICNCRISWIRNYETDCTLITSGLSSACPNNVAESYQHSLEAIASNRAFVRAVREGLNINTVAEDELNPNEEVKVVSSIAPTAVLEKICHERGIQLATLNKFLSGAGLPHEWLSFSSIPGELAVSALGLITKNQNAKTIEDLI